MHHKDEPSSKRMLDRTGTALMGGTCIGMGVEDRMLLQIDQSKLFKNRTAVSRPFHKLSISNCRSP
jgi:hypothetical protein